MSRTAGQSEQDDERSLVADALRYAARTLGTGNAGTEMGALEFVGSELKAGTERIADALRIGLEQIADALSGVAGALDSIATALQERKGEDS